MIGQINLHTVSKKLKVSPFQIPKCIKVGRWITELQTYQTERFIRRHIFLIAPQIAYLHALSHYRPIADVRRGTIIKQIGNICRLSCVIIIIITISSSIGSNGSRSECAIDDRCLRTASDRVTNTIDFVATRWLLIWRQMTRNIPHPSPSSPDSRRPV